MHTSAYYYDGKSSKPNLVWVNVYLGQNISFELDNLSFLWEFSELNFDKNNLDLTISKKNNPSEILVLSGMYHANQIYHSAKTTNNTNWYQNIIDLGSKFYLPSLCVLLCVISLFYFFVLPAISDHIIENTPRSFDKKLGDVFCKQVLNELEINKRKSTIVQEFANEIQFANNSKYTFKVVVENDINAYALPNGMIFINQGILEEMNNYSQLVALLGHETTHINERHSMKIISRSLAGYMIVSIITSDVNGVMSFILDNANQLNNLSFTRKFEESADKGSFDLLKKNKINPKGMIELFEILQKLGKDIPKALSTHPINEDRIKFSKKIISDNKYRYKENKKLELLFSELKN